MIAARALCAAARELCPRDQGAPAPILISSDLSKRLPPRTQGVNILLRRSRHPLLTRLHH
jgi:hypothetical protein